MRAAFVLGFVLLPIIGVGGASAAEDVPYMDARYMVEMELWVDGERRGTPIIVLPPGEQGSVEVGDKDGGQGWKIEVQVEPPTATEGAPLGSTWLSLAVHELEDGDWKQLADSLLGVPEGRSSSMSMVEPGIENATPENSLVHLTATASLLHPGERRP